MNQPTIEEWLATRPECVQKLAQEFPHGSRFTLPDGRTLHLLGYTESDSLICSEVDPFEDYMGALENKVFIHADCARKARG